MANNRARLAAHVDYRYHLVFRRTAKAIRHGWTAVRLRGTLSVPLYVASRPRGLGLSFRTLSVNDTEGTKFLCDLDKRVRAISQSADEFPDFFLERLWEDLLLVHFLH